MSTIKREEVGARIGTAADIGCTEPYSCQAGRGDPPMDCIWPDCPCGTLVIKPEYSSLSSITTEKEEKEAPKP